MFPTSMMFRLTNGYTPRVKDSLFCEYSEVQRWTKKLISPLWEKRLVFYPINQDKVHWTFVVVMTEVVKKCFHHTVCFYDSMGEKIKKGRSNKYQKVVQDYMEVMILYDPIYP